MIKRIFAFIILSFFITFKCLTWIPSAAISGIPAIDALEYTILQTIGMATQNGVDFDFTDSLADIIHDVSVGQYSVEYGLKEFLKRVAVEIWDTISFSDIDEEYKDVLVTAIGTASGNPTSLLKLINSEYQKKCLDNSYEIVTPVNYDTVSFWNKYKSDFINTFIERVNALPEDVVIPTPDPNYLSYINTLNESGFYFENYTNLGDATFNNHFPLSNYSFLAKDFLNSYSFSNNYVIEMVEKLNIHIDSNIDGSGNYVCVIPTQNLLQFAYNFNWSTSSVNYYSTQGKLINNSQLINIYDQYSSGPATHNSITLTGSLNDIFSALTKCVRNVNIYVNGTLWALAGSNIDQGITANVPNAVIDTSDEDGKIVANPIYWAVDDETGLPIDSQINLDALARLITSIIDGTRQDSTVGYNDLVDAGAIEDTDGNTLTDSDIDTISVADVIDASIARTDANSIVSTIAGVIPGLPILPSLSNPTSAGDPLGGFKGMSVLARIVNVTNRSLPDDLIIMFYGIVGVSIILGLIKILHK